MLGSAHCVVVLGYFNSGLFFLPNRWVELVSVKTSQQLILSPQERAVLSAAANLVHSFGEIKFA